MRKEMALGERGGKVRFRHSARMNRGILLDVIEEANGPGVGPTTPQGL